MGTPLTEHFSLEELLASRIAQDMGIDNTPPPEVIQQLHFTAAGLERIRDVLQFPMRILSGYRCDALNQAVGGSNNSQHIKGEAADFVCSQRGTPKNIAFLLAGKMGSLGIDQLIMEGTWIHVSFTLKPRGQVLTFRDGKYMGGLV